MVNRAEAATHLRLMPFKKKKLTFRSGVSIAVAVTTAMTAADEPESGEFNISRTDSSGIRFELDMIGAIAPTER